MQTRWAAWQWAGMSGIAGSCCSSNYQDVRLYCLPLSVWLTDPSQAAAAAAAVNPAPGARRMVAIFDYDPRESSPNTDIEVRLTYTYSNIFFQSKALYVCLCVVVAHYLPHVLWLDSGWADLQCRRHHTCVWWHGRRWLLLRKCQHDLEWSVFCHILLISSYFCTLLPKIAQWLLLNMLCFLYLF